MTFLANVSRNEGDPRILSTGPSSRGTTDRLARGLGWFSIGLGLTQLFAPRALTRMLGMEGQEGLVRAYGARELAAGMLSLAPEKQIGLWSRVAGDGLDIATLMTALRDDNPKRGNVGIAIATVLGVTALDVVAAQGTTMRHARGDSATRRSYRSRTGYPKGIEASRGAARDFRQPPDLQAIPRAAATSDAFASGGKPELAPKRRHEIAET